jgi:hypothetical protein
MKRIYSYGLALVGSLGAIYASVAPVNAAVYERVNNGGFTGFTLNFQNLNNGTRMDAADYSTLDDYQRIDTSAISFFTNNGLGAFTTKLYSHANNSKCFKADYIGNNSPIRAVDCGNGNPNIFAVENVYNGAYPDVRFRVNGSNYCINLPNVNLWNGGYVFLYQCAGNLAGDTEQIFRRRNL